MTTDAMADALDVTVRLVSVGLAITGTELLADRGAFASTGPFGRQVFAALRGANPTTLLAGPQGVSIVATAQVIAAVVLVALGAMSEWGRCALVALGITTTLVRRRRIIGGDGAEQMTDIVLLSAILALLPVPSDARITLAVIFIAAQAMLSYFTAGVAELVSPIVGVGRCGCGGRGWVAWRSGGALPAILGTYGHGLASVSPIMNTQPTVAFALGWAVILFEVSFPLVLIAPTPVAIVALGVGLTFHLGCAVLMGLNSFLWSFPATYACVLATSGSLLR